jgi:hypothetical protein
MKKISKENKEWLFRNGYVSAEGKVKFSDRFIAILSGTTSHGNSLKAPLQTIHEFGLIPKDMLPQVDSFSEYYDRSKITPSMIALGKEFLKRFTINYERVEQSAFGVVYAEDMVILAGYAWPEPVNGEYPRSEHTMNHVFIGIRHPLHIVFDNYIDPIDGDFIKKLAEDYNLFEYGYRVFIGELNAQVVAIQKKGFLEWLKNLWGIITMKHLPAHA